MDIDIGKTELVIDKVFADLINLLKVINNDLNLKSKICDISDIIVKTIEEEKKVLFFGNGGSAADSQHMAGEFISRFMMNRKSIPGIALTTDSSVMTSIANDYGFQDLFSRQIEGLGNEGDIAYAFSTSGKSPNVLKGLKIAKEKGLITIGMTGSNGYEMNNLCDYLIEIPSGIVPRIQEGHLLVGHLICQIVEEKLFN